MSWFAFAEMPKAEINWAWLKEQQDEQDRMVWALMGNDYSETKQPTQEVNVEEEAAELEMAVAQEREQKWTRQVRMRK